MGSALCADLDAKDPERLAQVEALYAERLDSFEMEAA
jgi:hypothetical protein